MSEDIKILITDDHSMIRKGIRLTIETTFGIKSIKEAASCSKMLSHLREKSITHLILDLLIGDGNSLELIPTIRVLYPELRILIFSMQPPEVYSLAAKQYGLYEYLHKEADENVTVNILRKFLLSDPSDQEKIEKEQYAERSNPFSILSARELEVLHYLLNGMGTKQISETLILQMSTVSTIKYRIFAKMGITNIKELIDLALAYNIHS